MTTIVKAPQSSQALIDQQGRLTISGLEVFDRLIKAVIENQEAIAAQTATLADHEGRLLAGGL